MGDVLTLIEQAERAFDADQAEKMASKLTTGENFTLEDFLEQMQAVRRMGPLANVLGLLPGMGQIREQLDQIDERDLDRITAIIRSMTPGERQNPRVLNRSRRARIAKGSGTTVTDVNQLVDRFYEAQKMLKQMTGSLGLPGARRKAKGKKGKKGKSRPAPRLPAGLPDLSKLQLPPSG